VSGTKVHSDYLGYIYSAANAVDRVASRPAPTPVLAHELTPEDADVLDMRELLTSCLERVRPLFNERRVEATLDSEIMKTPTVVANGANSMHRLFEAFLGIAAETTRPFGQVLLKATVTP